MIQLSPQRNGFGLFQNQTESRIDRSTFKALLDYLKNRFSCQFDSGLYNEQPGWIFFAPEAQLLHAIESFLAGIYAY